MKNIFHIFAIFFFISFCGNSFADINLSVSPADGSRSLRFDRLMSSFDNKKELRVRVTSTGAQRYQIFQRVQEPIVNEKGQSLNLRAVQVASAANSNAGGTLYLQSPDYLGLGEQLVYTSSQAGDADSFVLVYVVDPALVNAEGKFFGKIVFTLRPMNGGAQQQAVVDISLEAQSAWKLSVKGGRTPERVEVKDTDTAEKSADFVKIAFSGNKGQHIKIYQELEMMPMDATAQEIGANVINFSVASEAGNARAQGLMPLDRTRTLIYTGTASESVLLVYFLVDGEKAALANAGSYRGKIRYIVETERGPESFLIDLVCEIQPVFNMEVSLLGEGVRFTHVVPTNPPVEREVTVSVRTNLHKPYQVSQDLQSLMANEKGDIVAKEYFTMKAKIEGDQKGQVRAVDFIPMEVGEHVVFSSDRKGSPSTFKVVYRLQGYTGMSTGNFSAPVRFSLNQN